MGGPAGAGGGESRRHRLVRDLAGRPVGFDGDGFFWDFDEWTEEVAIALVREDGQPDLTEAQWLVIRFLREFFASHARAPLNQQLKAGTGQSLLELNDLFPGGLRDGARRLAGLPNPKSCR